MVGAAGAVCNKQDPTYYFLISEKFDYFLIFWFFDWLFECMYVCIFLPISEKFDDFLIFSEIWVLYHMSIITPNFFKFLQISSKSVEIWWFFEIFENFVCIISSLNCIIAYIFSMRSRNYENTTTTTLT